MSLRILIYEPDDHGFAELRRTIADANLSAYIRQVRDMPALIQAVKGSCASGDRFQGDRSDQDDADENMPDVVVAAYPEREDEALQLLTWTRNACPYIAFLFVTDPRGDEAAVRAIRAGASDYILRSDLGRLAPAIRNAVKASENEREQLRRQHEVRRVAEQVRESQKMATIGRLSGMITHEINNPLEAISNILYLLRHEGSLSPAAIHYLEIAEKEMARVVQISRQTLSFYREAAHPVKMRPKELLEEVLALLRRKLAAKNINVVRRYDFDEQVTLYPGEMRQVLSNLVVNAIEAMQPGGKLVVHVYETRRWNDHGLRGVRISVADTGIGIAPEQLRRIGQPFFTTKGQKGTGLGLWVSQGILRKYGGDLRIWSSTSPQHHGTVFSLFLPKEMRPVGPAKDAAALRDLEPRASTG